MATRTIYLTVRLDIDNPKADEIRTKRLTKLSAKWTMNSKITGTSEIDTEICGKNDEGGFRRYPDGQVIALFPDIPWSGRRGEITSYMHAASMAQPTMRA